MEIIQQNYTNGETGDREEMIGVVAIKTFPQFGGNREHVTIYTCYSNNAYSLDFADKDPDGVEPSEFNDDTVAEYVAKRMIDAVRERGGADDEEIRRWAEQFGFPVYAEI